MMQTPPINTPAQGWVPVVGRVVVVVDAVVDVVDGGGAAVVDVVVEDVGGFVVVVVVLVPPVTGRVVEVVVDDVLDEVVVDVLLDEIGGSLDGTHRMANRPSKNRRRGCPTRAAKQTSESAAATIG